MIEQTSEPATSAPAEKGIVGAEKNKADPAPPNKAQPKAENKAK